MVKLIPNQWQKIVSCILCIQRSHYHSLMHQYSSVKCFNHSLYRFSSPQWTVLPSVLYFRKPLSMTQARVRVGCLLFPLRLLTSAMRRKRIQRKRMNERKQYAKKNSFIQRRTFIQIMLKVTIQPWQCWKFVGMWTMIEVLVKKTNYNHSYLISSFII